MNRLFVAAITITALAACLPSAAEDETPPVPALAVAFSPDGKLLAVGFGSREVAGGLLLWDVENRRAKHVVRTEVGAFAVAFSPDGSRVVLSPYGRAPQVIDVDHGSVLATLADNRRGPAAFSPDGELLASGCSDRTIPLWEVNRGVDRLVLSGPKDVAYGNLAFSPDGSLLVAPCGRDGTYVWELATGEARHHLSHGSYFMRAALFSPDGKSIITGGFDGTARVWDVASGEERVRFSSVGGVDGMDYSAAGNLLAVCSTGNAIHLLELSFAEPDAAEIARIRELLGALEDDRYEAREEASAELVRIGIRAEDELRRAAAESLDAEVRIRARRARQAILSEPEATLTGHQGRVWSVAFSPDGKLLASASEDGTVRLWDVARRSEVGVIVPAKEEGTAVKRSP